MTRHAADAFHDLGTFVWLFPGEETIARWFWKAHATPRALALLLVVMLRAAAGCIHMTPTPQRALSGGAIGAAGGAAVGVIVGGSPALGAVMGGTAGTVVGALWEDIHKVLK